MTYSLYKCICLWFLFITESMILLTEIFNDEYAIDSLNACAMNSKFPVTIQSQILRSVCGNAQILQHENFIQS